MEITKSNVLFSLFLLALLYGCTMEEPGIPVETTVDDAFFAYSGGDFAMEDIISALKVQNDSTRFVPRFRKTYGQPVWSSKKVIPIGDEAIVAVPVKQSGKQAIETIWLFFARGNRMSYFPLTRRMAVDMPADVAWTFDYFTQELYPGSNYPVRFMTDPDNRIQTKSGIWIEYCVDYSITVEFEGETATSYGTHCWTEYYSLGHSIPTIDHIDPPFAGGGNVYILNRGDWTGGSVPPDYISPESSSEELNAIYAVSSSLNDELKGNLENALKQFNENPVLRRAYNILRTHFVNIKFHLDPTIGIGVHAYYNAEDKSIAFRTETDVLEQYLEEELIHAVQHVYYGSMNNTVNNYEFEAKVFRDIAGQWVEYGGLYTAMNLREDKIDEYRKWINNMMVRNPLSFTSADLEKYFYFLSYTTLSGSSNMNQLPQLLLSLIFNLKK